MTKENKHLTTIQAEIAALRKQYTDAATKQLFRQFHWLFVFLPTLESFSWTQYTPYFNDGDECVFSRYELYEEDALQFTCADPVADNFSDARGQHVGSYAILEFVNELLKGFEDALYKDLFGDHARVTVSRKGIEVYEYAHD